MPDRIVLGARSKRALSGYDARRTLWPALRLRSAGRWHRLMSWVLEITTPVPLSVMEPAMRALHAAL